MGQLSLAFLGNPQIRHVGEVLTFPTRKALALFIYLAVEKGLHSREKLAACFWPESDTNRGRATLRNTLGHLRSALHEITDAQPRESHAQQSHLIVERDALGFDFTSDFDLDLLTLETAFMQVRTPSAVRDAKGDVRARLLADLQHATTFYRGGFLEGLILGDAPPFDDWVSVQREVWHRRMSLLLNRLSQLQFESGEVVSAIDTTARWVAHDPLSEAAYQRLMRLHFAAGDREAALRAYETLRTTLKQELHAQPAPETKVLAERIRALAPPSRRVLHESTSLRPPPAVLEGPLVGRVDEYAMLVEVYQAVNSGKTQVVVVEGEAGIGKTRLVTEFLGWAAAQGADVLEARAFETGGRLPYQPVVEALRSRLERENAPEDLLSDTWLAELSRLLPELRDRYPDLPLPSSDEAVARTRLFEAIARLGQALAQRTALVVFIDDVHWADVASLDVLHYVSRCWTERSFPVLLLVSLRSEALLTTPLLTDWLVALRRDLTSNHLMLEPLTLDATLQLVQSLAHRRATEEEPPLPALQSPRQEHKVEQFGRWLFAETGGQPFFIMETLRVLLEGGALVPHSKEDGMWAVDIETALPEGMKPRSLLPPNVREMIRRRLARLSPTALGLLVAAAVLGQGFGFERLCQVAGIGENEGLAALDQLLLGRLLRTSREDRRAEAVYSFTHDKIREVVYTEAGEARRQVFHRRAFEALQMATAPAAEFAHHALNAKLMNPTFRFSLAAGDDAMRLFAVRDAIIYYEQTRHVLIEWTGKQDRQLRDIPATEVQHLYVQLGRACELSSDYHQAQMAYDAMLTFARERHEPAMECAALNRLATLAAWKSYDVETAGTLLQEALQVAESSGDRAGLAETEGNLAQMSFYTFRAQEARNHAERALTWARELDLQDLIARSLNVLAWANLHLGNLQEVIVHAEEAQAQYVAMGDRAMKADCLNLLALASLHTGLPEEALRAARTAQAVSIEIENAWGQMVSAHNLALGSREIGVYGEALAFAQQGVTIARPLGFPPNLMINLFMLGLIQGTILALSSARTTLLEAAALNENVQSRPHAEALAAVLCMNAALVGEWQEAYAYARQARASRDYLWSYGWHFTLWYETEALLRGGDIAQAEEEVRRFGEYMKDNRRYRLAYLRALAVLAAWKDQTEQALAHLQEAVRLAEEIGLPGECWHIQAALGEVYQARGDEEQARTAFVRAAEVVQSLANSIEDKQLRSTFLSAARAQRVLRWDGWPAESSP